MKRSAKASTAAAEIPRPLHLAARVEDAIHRLRERRGRRRGLVPTIIPFPGYGGDGWMRVLGRVVLVRPGRRAPDRYTSIRGWRSFTSIPVRDAEIRVRAGDTEHLIHADRGGVIDARIEVRLTPRWSSILLTLEGSDAIEAPVFVVEETVEFGLISDVDDTVMVTALPHPLLAAWNTFVRGEHARRPVPGMSVLFDRLMTAHPGSPVVYLSTGAWNIVPTLDRFLSRNLYPRGAFLLTDWGPTTDRWFRSGQEHKQASLARLAEEFPRLRWLLVGDDGQHDEERYREFADAHPENLAAVAIRELSPGEAVFAGGRAQREAHEGAAPWVYGADGAELAEELAALGLLDTPRA
ncbi:MAG: ACP synthase [Leifsonia xyli]|nr:MAG: ACP synthase [Leifsonia xyli]